MIEVKAVLGKGRIAVGVFRHPDNTYCLKFTELLEEHNINSNVPLEKIDNSKLVRIDNATYKCEKINELKY